MKEEKNKTNKPASEFQRYVRGEMTKRQENAFQRKLQRDPFAAEAAEGFSEITPAGAEEDLDSLGKRLKKRITGRRRIIYYRIAASIAVLMIISSVYIFKERNKPASELNKGAVTTTRQEVVNTNKTAEPALPVSENAVALKEELSEPEKGNEIKDKAAPVIAVAAPAQARAMDEMKDSVVLIAADQIAVADKQDSVVLITADMAAEQAAVVNEPILAEYKADAKNARIAGVEVTKAAYTGAVYIPPQPVTGKESFDKYIRENLRRPAKLADGDSAGVVISFTVKITGAIDDLKVISSPGDEFSDEAKRLVLEGPAWNPASRNGLIIDDEVRLTIIIK